MEPEGTTKEFINKLVSGSKERWKEFLDRYSRLIYKTFHAPSFGFSREEIDDLFNDFMVLIIARNYRKIRLFEGRNNCSFPSYLRKIAVNLAIDRQKQLARKKVVSLNQPSPRSDSDELGSFIESRAPLPSLPLEEKEDWQRYLWALYSLDIQKVLVIVLVIYHDMGRVEIASLLSTTRQNVDVIFKRAKDRLTDLLATKKSYQSLKTPEKSWDEEFIAQRNRLVLADRDLIFERCLKSLDVPKELLLGLLIINTPFLNPTPDRLSSLFRWTSKDLHVWIEKLLAKLDVP